MVSSASRRKIVHPSDRSTSHGATAKAFVRGTHRTVAPGETLRRFVRQSAVLGITRIANVTGLDYLGIPVFMAMRPNARSLSVAQGKGLDAASARASAFMEAAEHEHAERIAMPVRQAAYANLRKRAHVADPDRLPRPKDSRFRASLELPWVAGRDVVSDEPIWVPLEMVKIDFTVSSGARSGCFPCSSNGLASGNHPLEATCYAICELIERDATSLWRMRDDRQRASRRLDLSTATDGRARALLRKLGDQGISAAVWNITTDVGVPAFLCRVAETPDNDRSAFGAFWGSGCHLDRGIALVRAVTEAVQSRLTYIAGSRDDLVRKGYDETPGDALRRLIVDRSEQRIAGQSFADVPDGVVATFEADIALLLARLAAVGCDQVIAVDLTRPGIGIPVVRMIVPGLEGSSEHPGYVPGARAQTMAQR